MVVLQKFVGTGPPHGGIHAEEEEVNDIGDGRTPSVGRHVQEDDLGGLAVFVPSKAAKIMMKSANNHFMLTILEEHVVEPHVSVADGVEAVLDGHVV